MPSEHLSHILIVEDEKDLAELLAFNLEAAGYAVTSVHSGAAAIATARKEDPALVVLDLMLPDVSGIEVCRALRGEANTKAVPILMLTAKGEEADRIQGFEAGADDYVVKPFSPQELVLRIRAILRRAGEDTELRGRLQLGDLEIDASAHRALWHDEELPLTALEFRLLLDLATREGQVQSRGELLERVWGYAPGVETRTVDTHVKRLREKLGAAASVIETVRGVGYRFVSDAQ